MITFDEYLQKINELVETNPEIKNFTLVYSIDDEGNGFQKVGYLPSIGKFDDYDFLTLSDLDEGDIPNALCVN